HEPALLPTVILQSFSEESLRTLGRLAPAIPRVRLIESEVGAPAIIERLPAIAHYAQAIGPAQNTIDESVIHAAHELSVAVHPYTVNDEGTMERLIAAGVDGMFTDNPALLYSRIQSVIR